VQKRRAHKLDPTRKSAISVSSELRRPIFDLHFVDLEPNALESILHPHFRREEPRVRCFRLFGRYTVLHERVDERRHDLRDVPVTAHLEHKGAAWFETAMYGAQSIHTRGAVA